MKRGLILGGLMIIFACSLVLAFSITVNFPENGETYNISGIDINYTLNINKDVESIDSCWWTNDSGQTNNSISCGKNITGQIWDEGENTIILYANDNNSINYSNSVIFDINTTVLEENDTTAPEITINSPSNDSVNSQESNSIDIKVEINENGSCEYSLDAGITNNSMSSLNNMSFNATNDSIAAENYVINIYCEDLNENKAIKTRAFTLCWCDSWSDAGCGYDDNDDYKLKRERECYPSECGQEEDWETTQECEEDDDDGEDTSSSTESDSGGSNDDWADSLNDTEEDSTGSLIQTSEGVYYITSNLLSSGKIISLAEGEKVKFLVESKTHHVYIEYVDSSQVNIEVNSTPQKAVLNLGDFKNFEITNDSYYDLFVQYDSFDNETNKSDILIKSIHEEIGADSDNGDGNSEDSSVTGDVIAEQEEGAGNKTRFAGITGGIVGAVKRFRYIFVFLGVVGVAAGVVVGRKHLKKKKALRGY